VKALLSDRRAQIVAALVLVALVIGVVVLTRPSSKDATSVADGATSTVTGDPASTASTSSTASPTTDPAVAAPSTSVPSTSTTRDVHFPVADLPLTVTSSDTSGLKGGDKVSFHIVPKGDSQVFGVSVRLCSGDAKIRNLDDFEPATTGLCIGHRLSPNSDLLIETSGNPPYQTLDVDFRVGVGTDSFQMTDGTPVTVTCGPANPCQIVLLLQIPNAFGFQTFPVTYR
jgi:hypothetical protein